MKEHAAQRTGGMLLERDEEAAAIAALLDGLAGAAGGLLVIEGEPGAGKTELVRLAQLEAEARGVEVLRARGGEFERDLTFGVARQLLEARLLRAPAGERAAVLGGAAVRAAPLLGAEPAPDAETAADEPALVHALYWVVANLAERGPLLVAVDDAQWSDLGSLRLLLYLARRLEELPVALLVAVRAGEPGAPGDLLEALGHQSGAMRLALAPLGPSATAELVRREAGPEASDAFCAAMHEAAGGNPFLVREAVASLLADDGADLTRAPAAVAPLRTPAVAHSVLRRLAGLPTAAAWVTQAVAVLGTDATLAHVAALAGVDASAAARLADRLAEARILEPGRPLAFVHPVVRSTVYEAIAPGERSNAHTRAAHLLVAAGADVRSAMTHLLAAEPAGDPEAARLLARAAAVEPDPARAVAALRRALAEPPAADDRPRLLLALGEAEMRAYDPAAVGHLTEARELATDAEEFLEATQALARGWTLDPDPGAALAWARAELERVPRAATEVRLSLQALAAIRGPVDADAAAQLRAGAWAARTPAERYGLAALAYKGTDHTTAQETVVLARRALAGGLHEEGVRGTGAILVLAALEQADALDLAADVAADMLASARGCGDVSGSALALTVRAGISARRGDLAGAVAEAEEALALADAHGLAWAHPVAIGTLLEALAGLGRTADAEALLAERELSAWQQGSVRSALYRHARAHLRLAQARADEALADFRAAGEVVQRYEVDHPAMLGWRSGAAEALLLLGERAQAAALAADEQRRAEPYGAAQPVGIALRVRGLAEGSLDLLRQAATTLERSEARLERARALVDLGAALRRAGERAQAREPLRAGLDLAHRCGAAPLAGRAHDELEASGARPRRHAVTGVDALTPSERRVADLAAGGLSNRAIAQGLFLSVRTVENQLRQVYSKLGIASRRELAPMLSGDHS